MKLKKYLKYNNINLVDHTNSFHASCMAFYEERGFLSPKQLQALRMYCFSPEDITRLTSKEPQAIPVTKVADEPTPYKRPKLPTTEAVKPAKKLSKKAQKKLEDNPF